MGTSTFYGRSRFKTSRQLSSLIPSALCSRIGACLYPRSSASLRTSVGAETMDGGIVSILATRYCSADGLRLDVTAQGHANIPSSYVRDDFTFISLILPRCSVMGGERGWFTFDSCYYRVFLFVLWLNILYLVCSYKTFFIFSRVFVSKRLKEKLGNYIVRLAYMQFENFWL